MGHRHSHDEILAGALEVAVDAGLSQLTFGRVAKHLDISDRVVVYYFPTKPDLISAVIAAMGLELQDTLAAAFAEPATDHRELVERAWPILTESSADRVFALFFEANGLAAAGREPYRTLVPRLVDGWIEWAATLVEGTPEQRRTAAETSIAVIDGLLLLRLLAGPAAAERAARHLGVVSD